MTSSATGAAHRQCRCVRRTLVLVWTSVLLGMLTSLALAARVVWDAGDLHDGTWALAAQNLVRRSYAILPFTATVWLVGLVLAAVAARRWPRWPEVERLVRPWCAPVVGLVSAAVLSAWGVALVGAARLGAGSDAPNVILVVVDTLRADHVGCYGSTRQATPHSDALAREAFVFQRAYSAAPWTRPAVASVLTGTTPFAHGITAERLHHALAPRVLTLQEYLRNEGYWTHALLTNPHYRLGIDQNFDQVSYCGNCSADAVYTQATRFVRAHRGGPFFLLIHNNDPHDSYDHHEGFSTTPARSSYRSLGPLLPARDRDVELDSTSNIQGTVILDAAALEELTRNYDGEIAFLDHHLGRFVDVLRERRLLDRTILAITADHGEEFLDHGGYGHGGTLFEELLRIPLILRVPGRDGGVISTRVSTVDLFATLADLTRGHPPAAPHSAGRSMRPLLDGQVRPAAPIFAASAFRSRLKYSVIDGDYKLMVYASGEAIGLFNVLEDPGERRDLHRVEGARTQALRRVLAAHMAATQRDGEARPAARLEASEREQLRSLGYEID